MQRKATNQAEPSSVPPIVHEVLRSPGQPLDPAIRSFMEPRFEHDFSSVRVHTDAQAAESARAVNARAYTVGSDVVFGAGQYKPGETSGKRLLAHELAHTLQQNGIREATTRVDEVASPHSLAEREADQSAEAVVHNGSAKISASMSRSALHRQPQPEQDDLPQVKAQQKAPQPQVLNSRTFVTTLDSFALNSDTLTPAHLDEIDKLAWSIALHLGMLRNGQVRITLTGHTDSSGDEQPNQSLGQRRADNVHRFLEKALQAQNIPADRIANTQTLSMGETQLKVPTKDGTKEPKNRRVEIEVTLEALQTPTNPQEQGQKKPPNLNLPPDYKLPEEDWWKRMEREMEIIQEFDRTHPQKSWNLNDVLVEAVTKALDPIIRELPKGLRDKAREGIRKGIEAGTEKACEAAIDASGVTGAEAEALKSACKAALNTKPGEKK
ncbi:MAG: hypothetical protein Fur0022_08880 [Anaerolineales bacterium]